MIAALRKLTIVLVVIAFVLIAAVFAYGNQEPIDIDIGIMRLEDVSLTATLALTFTAGALFGGILSTLALVNHMRERHSLRRRIRRQEAEIDELRSLPMTDAD